MTPGIVLGAGASTRMASPKPLLRIGSDTFARRVVDTLTRGGVSRVVFVTRPGVDRAALQLEDRAMIAVNPDPAVGQLSSLVTGLDALEDGSDASSAVLVTLVDMPLISPATVGALLERARASPACILRATYRGRHGHPVIFKREVFAALRGADRAVGAKAVFDRFSVEDVPVEDAGAVEDIDTPSDFARLVNHRPPNP